MKTKIRSSGSCTTLLTNLASFSASESCLLGFSRLTQTISSASFPATVCFHVKVLAGHFPILLRAVPARTQTIDTHPPVSWAGFNQALLWPPKVLAFRFRCLLGWASDECRQISAAGSGAQAQLIQREVRRAWKDVPSHVFHGAGWPLVGVLPVVHVTADVSAR